MHLTSRLEPQETLLERSAGCTISRHDCTRRLFKQKQQYQKVARSQPYTKKENQAQRFSTKEVEKFLLSNLVKCVALVATLSLLLEAPLILTQETTTTAATTTVDQLSTSTMKLLQSNQPELPPATLDQPETATIPPNQLNANGNVKLKPINFTLVDEVFDSVLSEDEVVKRWKSMDSQIQDGMKAILKMLFPQIVSISQDARVSGDCSGGILKWILSLRNLRSWAIKMLDATGKPTAGIFEGSLTMFGNYRQCLSIRAPDEDEIEISEQFEEYFRGQYCVLHLKPWMPVKRPYYNLNSTIDSLLRRNYKYYEKTLYDELAEIAIAFNFIDIRMDLCVPSTCTVADIQRVAELLSKKLEMRAKVMRCDIASRELNIFNHTDRHIYLWLLIPVSLIVITLLATLLATLLRIKRSATSSQSEDSKEERKLATILHCLSIISIYKERISGAKYPSNLFRSNAPYNGADDDDTLNSSSAIDTDSRSSDQVSNNNHLRTIDCTLRKGLPLYGLRSIFVLWFIIIQMTVELKYQYLRESLTLRNMLISYWPFQIIVNSVLLFDSIILITAFTYSYVCLESKIQDIIAYVVDKYTRLILPIITVIAMTIVTPLIAIESPVWRNFVEQQSSICKSNGYLNIFFLQNFVAYDKICLPHTWLFCVEIQLIILSIPLILLLNKNFLSTEDRIIIGKEEEKKSDRSSSLLGVIFSSLLFSKCGLLSILVIGIGVFLNFFLVYTNQLPPSWFYTFPDVAQKNFYFGHYLTKTWTHLSVFTIGLLGGHICKSIVQLQSLKTLRDNQANQQRASGQPSPVPSSSTGQSQFASRQIHGSTSTIMAMEQGQQSNNSKNITSELQNGSLFRCSLPIAAIVCMAATIFSTYKWSTQEIPSTLVAAIYDASSRFLWSIALVVLMIQLCLPDGETRKFSKASQILSSPVCILLGRLSFLAYLILPYVHTFVLAVEEQSLFPSLFIMFHVIVGNIVITYALAFILAIMIEQPIRRLVNRYVFGKRFCQQKINISLYYSNTPNSKMS